MFAYTDPSKDGLLEEKGALDPYRSAVHSEYRLGALKPGSGFTLLDAFDELAGGEDGRLDTVSWVAFPRSAQGGHQQIDKRRFQLQDEYVEWRVEKTAAGRISRITFTTDFSEYYMALAAAGLEVLISAIKALQPSANPTDQELFGPNFNASSASPSTRAQRLRQHAQRNPWVNGEKEILFLAHVSNTMGALVGLVVQCAIPRTDLSPSDVCANVGGACDSGRNSDPAVCTAVQNLVRSGRAVSLADPIGIAIQGLNGIWKISGRQIDINDSGANEGTWKITRHGRRAVLNVIPALTMGDEPVESGAQVATALTVGATVISSPETALPAWAKTGQESSRRIV